MLLNLNFVPKNLDNSDIGTESVAKILANALAFSKSDSPLKMLIIAQELYLNGVVDISLEDLNKIKDFVEKDVNFLNILKGAILSEIDKITK